VFAVWNVQDAGSARKGGSLSKIFGKCANCGATILFGPSEGEHKFCSKKCYQFWKHPGYCEVCTQATTDESVGGTYTVNFVLGTRMMGFGAGCPTCGSREMRKWLWVILPLFPISARYRVLYQTSATFFSRKIRQQPG